MAKLKTTFKCQTCGYQSTNWMGCCPDCQEWNTFEEVVVGKGITKNLKKEGVSQPKRLTEINHATYERIKTGVNEFDRVMGGGVAKGSLSLIGGEPGIGKSTLLIDIVGRISKNHKAKCLYISGEESLEQVGDRARRLGISSGNIYLLHETRWEIIKEEILRLKPLFVVLDSIQTTSIDGIQSAPGTISQIREVTYELMNLAKTKGVTSFVIGHITKEGSIAGPKVLEHMVDSVVYFEGDQHGQYRLLRPIKNRFGKTDEIGIFEMCSEGLKEVQNPSMFFLDNNENSTGSALSCMVEGSRPILVEIQSLVVENKYGSGRRTTQGLDSNRLAMMIAIIEKFSGIKMDLSDIYCNIVGGLKVTQRDTDLAIIASLLCSYNNRSIPQDSVFIGEVGLNGRIRCNKNIESRIKELETLNYKTVYTPKSVAEKYNEISKINLVPINNIKELVEIIC